MKRDTWNQDQNAELAASKPVWYGKMDNHELERLKTELGVALPIEWHFEKGIIDGDSDGLDKNETSGVWGSTEPIFNEGSLDRSIFDERGPEIKGHRVYVQCPIGVAMANDIIIHELHHAAEAETTVLKLQTELKEGNILAGMDIVQTYAQSGGDEEDCHKLSEQMHGKFAVAVEGPGPQSGVPVPDFIAGMESAAKDPAKQIVRGPQDLRNAGIIA